LRLCNKTPTDSSALANIDFERVYEWVIEKEDDDEDGKRMPRQVLVSGAFINADISATFNKNALSLRGSYKTKKTSETGAVGDVVVKVQQIFQRVSCSDFRATSKVRGATSERRAYSNDAGDENHTSLGFFTRPAPLPIATIFLTIIPNLFAIRFAHLS